MKVITFNGKSIVEPGSYSKVTGGDADVADAATSGKVLIIDTGSMAGYGYGSGITGDNMSGDDSIYEFISIDDFKLAVTGSVMADAARWLFKPSKSLDVKGVDSIKIVRAATTKKAKQTLNFVGGGTRATGTFIFTSIPANNDTITPNGIAYTFKTSPTLATDLPILGTIQETLIAAANILSQSTNAALTPMTFTVGGSLYTKIAVTAVAPGTAGNAYTLAASAASVSGANLTGGLAGSGANGGTLVFSTKVEGGTANGQTNLVSELYKGFALKVVAGVQDTTKFSLEFWKGTFMGLDWNSRPFDDISRDTCLPILITKSPEFSTISEVVDWTTGSTEFNSWFNLDSYTINGTGALLAADTTTYAGYLPFAQASESYSSNDFTKVMKYVKETDYSFILADKYETNGNDTKNFQLQQLCQIANNKFERILVIGGGADSTQFSGSSACSVDLAVSMNDEKVHVFHSRVYVNEKIGNGKREYPTVYGAAALIGRMAGNPVQVPVTWADLAFDSIKDKLALPDREFAIQKGVSHLKKVDSLGWVINADINTKQKNTQDIYSDGTSPFGSIVRIKQLLNKEIILDMALQFVPQKNANTASPTDVKSWMQKKLADNTSSKEKDNLLLSSKEVTVALKGSDYFVKYKFVPNGPINRLFSTGFMYSVSASA